MLLVVTRDDPLLRTTGEDGSEENADAETERKRLAKYTGLSVMEVLQREEQAIAGDDRTELAACALIFNRPLASRALASRVCIVCLAQLMTEGHVPSPEPNTGRDGASNFESMRRAIVGGNRSPSRSLQVAADAHNREMHALNGNIYYCAVENETRA
ncbi:hypothetical protein ACJJTC_007980 [Scirpophaga incertulas]